MDRLVEATVTALPQGNLQRLAARARYAQPVVALSVQDAIGRLRVLVPDQSDLSADRLAAAITAMSGVRQRFPWAAVRLASFDDASALTHRPVAGSVLESNLLEIHISRDLLLVSEEGAATSVAWLLAVVVHECWHLVQSVFEAADVRGGDRFQQALGSHLGLDRMGDAFVTGPRSSPERRASALAEVRSAVGDYATTNPREATAELFTAWWLGRSNHPLVTAFGALVDQFLPQER